MHKLDIKEIKNAANGKWWDIYHALCPTLVDALNITTKRTVHVDCPFCGTVKSFRFKKNRADTGSCICVCNEGRSRSQLDVIMAANHVDIVDAAQMVSRYLFGGEPDELDLAKARRMQEVFAIRRQAEDLDESTFMIDLINKTWDASKDIHDPSNHKNALLWLRSIGYTGQGDDIRFCPSQMHQEFRTNYHPTFNVLIRDQDGRVCSIQHHYLNDECTDYAYEDWTVYKRQIPYPPSLRAKSVAMRLSPVVNGDLGITEGFRSAIGASALHPGIPVWPVVSDYWVKVFIPPSGVKRLFLFYDKDKSDAGLVASDELADRLCCERPEIQIIYKEPPLPLNDRKSVDWFDVFQHEVAKHMSSTG